MPRSRTGGWADGWLARYYAQRREALLAFLVGGCPQADAGDIIQDTITPIGRRYWPTVRPLDNLRSAASGELLAQLRALNGLGIDLTADQTRVTTRLRADQH